ncbi:MAG: hypothetical protein AB1921_06110 [Thermodesulfobacteriota bacterium]
MEITAQEKPQEGGPGRILRVKWGVNPNSSSMGSLVFALPAALLAVTVGFGAVSALILARFIQKPPDMVEKEVAARPDKSSSPDTAVGP